MKKWYYAPADDAYIELEDSVYELLTDTIEKIGLYCYLRPDLSPVEIVEGFPDVCYLEHQLKQALTAEQWELYKTAPLY